MEDRFDKLEERLIRLEDKSDKLLEISIKNMAVLEVHEQRSTVNEEGLKIIRQEMIPIKSHVAFMNIAAKVLVGLGTFAGFLYKLGLFRA